MLPKHLTSGHGPASAGGDYRRPSRFADAPPSAQDMPDKHPRGFQDAPPLRPDPADSRGSFQGYGKASNSSLLGQPGVGDFRGLQDKRASPYPGSQPLSGAGTDTHPAPPSFSQPPPGGMPPYARPPPSIPSAGFSGPHWAGRAPPAAPNGRQDWRPGFAGSSGPTSDYHNPVHQPPPRLPGSWQADGMPFSRFH